MPDKCVILLEDEPDLAELVQDLLEEEDYRVVHVTTPEALLGEAARRSPCVALVDGLDPSEFDLWWIGPKLSRLGVPPVAFTAHSKARQEYQADAHDFVGVISKPFDAEEFLDLVNQICWDEHHTAAS